MFGRRALRRAEAVETGERFKIERPVLLLSGHAALFGCTGYFGWGLNVKGPVDDDWA